MSNTVAGRLQFDNSQECIAKKRQWRRQANENTLERNASITACAKRTIPVQPQKKNFITFVHLFPMFQLLYCLAHLHSFIYLFMCHFCYTEHVSFICIEQLCWGFLNNHFINMFLVLYDYYYFGGCRASGYVWP